MSEKEPNIGGQAGRELTPEEAQVELEALEGSVHALASDMEDIFRGFLQSEKANEESIKGESAQFRNLDVNDLTSYDLVMFTRVKNGDFNGSEGIAVFSEIRDRIMVLLSRAGDTPAHRSRRAFYAYLGNLIRE